MTHTGEKPRQCSTCDECFRAMGNLNIHLTTHRGEKPYPCKLCEKSFSSNNELKAHIVTHTGEKPNQCSIDSAAAATAAADAISITAASGYVVRNWPGAWVCSLSRLRCKRARSENQKKNASFLASTPLPWATPAVPPTRHRRRLRRHYHSRQCLRSTRPKLWTLPCQG